MSAAFGQDELNAAIVAYLQWRRSSYPRRDADAVGAAARTGAPDALLQRVEALVSECGRVDVDWSSHDLAEGTVLVREEMARRHPGLDTDALDALAWDFSYGWK